jgi:hypothetical protein
MKELTFVISFYNQQAILKKHISFWKKFSPKHKEKTSFLIVDDCSKKSAIDVLKNEQDIDDLDIHLYRVKEDLFCNIAGVRNLGFQEMKTEWGLLLDMDTLVDNEMASKLLLLTKTNQTNIAYKFNRKVPKNPRHVKNGQFHPAVTLIRREDYWSIGGCEEDLVGHYGQTDPSFWHCAKNKIKVYFCKDIFLTYDPEGECDMIRDTTHNTQLFEKKKKDNSWSTDFIRFDWEKNQF